MIPDMKAQGLEFDPESHTYRIYGDIVPSVTQVIERLQLCDTRWFTDDARERGTIVHSAIELHESGDLDMDSIRPDCLPYFEAYLKFRDDSGFEPFAVEAKLGSRLHRYAGTLDLFGLYGDDAALIDTKTGGDYRWYALQLAGYSQLLAEHGELVNRRRVLQLRRDATFRLIKPQMDDERADALWAAAVALYHEIELNNPASKQQEDAA